MKPTRRAARQPAFAVAALVLALCTDVSAQAEQTRATTPVPSVDVPGATGAGPAPQAADRSQAPTDWGALKPTSGYRFEDPFSVLTRDQLRELRDLARMLQLGAKPNDGTESGGAVAALYARLAQQGIDADGLLSRRKEVAEERRRAAMQVNPGIVDHEIEIVGFPMPAALASGDATSFFLVPYPGMCSHVTLPPPNQVILVTIDAPRGQLDFRAPVRVKGAIRNVPGRHDVILVDGRAIVEHAYLITKADISMLPGFSMPPAAQTRLASPVERHSEDCGHEQ